MATRKPTAQAEARRLQKEMAGDLTLQEQGPADGRIGRSATTFVHCTHPETGLDVVFLPGELLPPWAQAS